MQEMTLQQAMAKASFSPAFLEQNLDLFAAVGSDRMVKEVKEGTLIEVFHNAMWALRSDIMDASFQDDVAPEDTEEHLERFDMAWKVVNRALTTSQRLSALKEKNEKS